MGKTSRQVRVGHVAIGGGAPITVQSMTKTDTRDVAATVAQIKALEEAGCDIIRIAVPDMEAAGAVGAIKAQIGIPLVADIHFHYRLALEAISQGADKLRLNPGNIGERDKVGKVVEAAGEAGIPIRVGSNMGSLPKHVEEKYLDELMTAEGAGRALVEGAMAHIQILEELGFRDIVVSLKSFDVPATIRACQIMSEERDYPLHLGVTEAGLPPAGIIRSTAGIATLLAQGIGDTIRVSLTADPVEEVRVGREILNALHLRLGGVVLVACPSCGRCEIDLFGVSEEVERRLAPLDRLLREKGKMIRVSIMGCVVNGPGEARDAHVGIAGGREKAVLYRKGRRVRVVSGADLIPALVSEVERAAEEILQAAPEP
jgi:(E)-4-hydroxy-3-methylbut-2-enyl-diphosphate synthase